MPYCYICNRTVEIISVSKFSDHEESVFSCGHTSRLVKRSITEGISISESIEVTPKKGEKIPVTISGDTGAKIQGDLQKINVQIVENKPVYYNVNVTNINAPLKDVELSQSISETNTIDNILANLERSSLSTDIKNDVRNLVNEFDQESKQATPDQGKLKSVLSKTFPIAKDIGLMLLKHALDHGLLDSSSLFH